MVSSIDVAAYAGEANPKYGQPIAMVLTALVRHGMPVYRRC
jgi:hypothetical protein